MMESKMTHSDAAKQVALQQIAELARQADVSIDEIRQVVEGESLGVVSQDGQVAARPALSYKTLFSQVMFAVAGVLLFFALYTGLYLSVGGSALAMGLLLCLLTAMSWTPAVVARKREVGSVVHGMSYVFFMVGSLGLLAAVMHFSYHTLDGLGWFTVQDEWVATYVFALGGAIAAMLHILYGRLLRSGFALGVATLVMWLSASAALVTTLYYIGKVDAVIVYQSLTLFLCSLLPMTAYAVSYEATHFCPSLRSGYVVVGQLLALIILLVLSMGGDNPGFWQLVTAVGLLLMLHMAAIHKKRAGFIMASIALVIFIIQFVVRYFSGGSVAIGLFLASLVVLGMAVGLVSLHKRVFDR